MATALSSKPVDQLFHIMPDPCKLFQSSDVSNGKLGCESWGLEMLDSETEMVRAAMSGHLACRQKKDTF